MGKYDLGKIYKFEFEGNSYVGSTCEPTLARRRANHVSASRFDGSKGMPLYQAINNREGGWIGIHAILVEDFPCTNRDQLFARGAHWIKELKPNLNVLMPYRTKEEKTRIAKLLKQEYVAKNTEKVARPSETIAPRS